MNRRCFWPPESFAEAGGELGVRPSRSASGRQSAGFAVEGGVQLQRLPDGELRLQLALLELGAEQPGDPLVVGDRVEARDPHRAAVRDAQALDAFDGGGLAGAVRAEDPEDLPLLDGEGHPVDDGPAAVGLAQIPALR